MSSLGLQQTQRTELSLTPQQIQLQKLIQMNNIELEQKIQQEVIENPILEFANEGSDNFEEMDEFSEEPDTLDTLDMEESSYLDDDYSFEDYLHDAEVDEVATSFYDKDAADPTANQFAGFAYKSSLTEQLLEQLRWHDLPEIEEKFAKMIIGYLDSNGYLTTPLETLIKEFAIIENIKIDKNTAEKVLKLIQTFEPPGIAARDLKECLLIQLNYINITKENWSICVDIIEKHFDLFLNQKYQQLRSKLRISQDKLVEVIEILLKLNPKPGEGFDNEENNRIIPDFIIEKIGDSYEIILNDRAASSLTINKEYVKIFEQNKRKRNLSKSDKQAHNYIKDKYESAKLLIEAIKQRRKTLLSIMRSLFVRQFDFFEKGPKFLKPLLYKDLAEELNFDIATISRAVRGKYVEYKGEIYELKYFFSEGLPTDDGDVLAVKHIKELIKEIIDQEPADKPISDDKIAELLQEKGIQIARRTVTKYREAMGIPVARLRKRIMG
ncbi:MAG TPA: RNA polymerase factor sigma-54 [Ignavibacteriales bacterium]|nr:RNA polymerase factor sigma-54 [Ignavibacteriales bacterium]